MKKIYKYAVVACVAIGAKGFAQIGVPAKPEVSMTFDHPFFDASNYTNGVPNNQNKGLYFPSTDLTKWTFKTDNLDGITFPTAFNGMVVYNTGSGNTLADASKAGKTVTVEPGFYYFYNPDNAEGTSIVNGYWKAFNAGDTPSQPWYDVASQTQATDNTQNIYQMGRVGVYTQKPNATLQIDASGQADQPDGLLIPRILLSDLKTKEDTAYDAAQNATLIYIIDDVNGSGSGTGTRAATSKTENVVRSGFYYYAAKASQWKALETKAINGLTLTENNVIRLGGQLFEDTTLSGANTLTLETPTTVSGALQITSGTPGTGKVLTSDATGNASWKDQNMLSGNWFYMPSINLDMSSLSPKTVDLFAQGVSQLIGTSIASSSGAVKPVLPTTATAYDYMYIGGSGHITNVSISTTGVMTYTPTTINPPASAYISVMIRVK